MHSALKAFSVCVLCVLSFSRKVHVRSHVNFHVFSGEFPELCAVLVLPVARGVVVHNAAEALPLHWHAQPNAQPSGQQ